MFYDIREVPPHDKQKIKLEGCTNITMTGRQVRYVCSDGIYVFGEKSREFQNIESIRTEKKPINDMGSLISK